MPERLQGHVEERDAFIREHGVVHVSNGMLHLTTDPATLQPFKAFQKLAEFGINVPH